MSHPRPGLSTLAVHAGTPEGANAPLTVPIVQSTTFRFESAAQVQEYARGSSGLFMYSRDENPTVRAAEGAVARLEGAESAVVFGSGMGAMTTALMGLVSAGDEDPDASEDACLLLADWTIGRTGASDFDPDLLSRIARASAAKGDLPRTVAACRAVISACSTRELSSQFAWDAWDAWDTPQLQHLISPSLHQSTLERYSTNTPLRQQPGFQFLRVELDRWCVPIQHRPLNPAIVSVPSNLKQTFEKGRSDTDSAHLRQHEQVF